MTVDSMYYEAHVYELRGESTSVALHRAFTSQRARGYFGSRYVRTSTYAAWVKFERPWYQRRWLVPAIAAALFPTAGAVRALLYASILGYVLLGPMLFALMRRRFSSGVSLAIAVACLLLPPVRDFAAQPLTDSWGLTLEVAALLAALAALERGGRWIGVWVATMLALSFTRDATIVLIAAVGWIAVTTRTRRTVAVLGSGVAASVPALALFGAPLVIQLSSALQGYRFPLPQAASWSFLMGHYPAAISELLHKDVVYPGALSVPYFWYGLAAVTLAALGYMLFRSPRRSSFFALHRATVVGAAATVALSGVYTALRVELVFVPSVAVALAFSVERLRASSRVASFSQLFRTSAALAHGDAGPS